MLNTGDTAEPEVFVQAIKQGLVASQGEGAMTIASRLIDIGVQQGMQQGVQTGQKQGRTYFLLSLLERKFGPIPAMYRLRIEQASNDQLLDWGSKLLEVSTLSALFEERVSTITA